MPSSNWFYGLIAVYYQSRLMNEGKKAYLSHSLPLGYRYPLGNCDRRWIGWAWQPDGYSCTAVAISRLATLVNPCWVGCFAIPC